MIVLKGKGVSRGMVRGSLCFYHRRHTCPQREAAWAPKEEKARFLAARQQAVEQLTALAQKCRRALGQETASIFETHALLAQDEDFNELVARAIEEEGLCAEAAVRAAGEQLSQMLAGLEDDYMQARGADVLDVAARMARILTGEKSFPLLLENPVILAAEDLAPSETMELDKRMILGLVTEKGSATSHTAILARSLGIPAVCGVRGLFSLEQETGPAFLDGYTGELMLHPDAVAAAKWQMKLERQEQKREELRALRDAEDITLNGRQLRLFCNIGSAADLEAVKENGGRGVGLLRSEFLFLDRDALPDEESQFAAYKAVAQGMEGKPVIIRTLDIGSDKQTACLPLPQEENPALGLRGVRVCLDRPELFKTQLRAIYRASAFGRLAVMFPMITSVWEVQECKKLCCQVMEELTREKRPFCAGLEMGVMIETPAAVLLAQELAGQVDFFSVGTNDLTQYLLACDRQSACLGKYYDPHHPAVLRALKMVVDAAHAKGRWVGICGELGADLDLLPVFLDLGVDELSVSPASVLPVRQAWRALDEDAGGAWVRQTAPQKKENVMNGDPIEMIEKLKKEDQKWT